MSYVVLARRYRPQTLDQIIGQEHISRTLKNAIAENRVAHAYMFSGPRGVGKTTTARILAKALNCKKGPTAEPCGECSNCKEITAGTSVDVQEIDGASNRGIDEIRALRDNVKFAPATSKYKIYIIDEAHQITDAAFNALLKTLEEPPPHVVFILATTESHKVPVTILSRCQRYRFRFLTSKEISSTLENIIKADGFEIEPDALQMVTAASGGSMRDALSLMDQAISFVPGKITAQDIQDLLGFLPREIIAAVTESFATGDNARILSIIRDVNDQGHNLLQFTRDLREHLRRILLFKVNPAILEMTAEEKKILEAQQQLFAPDWLIRSGHLLSKALDEMRWSDQARLVLELYLLKIAQPYAGITELVERLEKMEKNMPVDPELPAVAPLPRSVAAPVATYAPASSVPFGVPTPAPAPVARPAAPAAKAPVAEESQPVNLPKDISIVWDEVVAEFGRTRPIIASVLAGVTLEGNTGNALILSVRNAFQQEGIKRNQQAIEDLIEKKAGKRFALKLSVNEAPVAAAPVAVAKQELEEVVVEEEMAPAEQKEMFQVEGSTADAPVSLPAGLDKIAKKFPGKITKKSASES